MTRTKAKLTLPGGAQVIVEGAPAEVADVVHRLGSQSKEATVERDLSKRKTTKNRKIKTSPTDLILSLADGGFFKSPKDLASIKEGLAEIGHIYPVQTLSSILFKMVRRRYLRRIKQDGRWVYVR